jgi:putative aldouronate transport system permease protein
LITGSKTILSKLYDMANYFLLSIIGISCLLPVIHIFAVSLSDSASASANLVMFVPKGFNLKSYREVLHSQFFLSSAGIAIARTIIGTSINVIVMLLTAYPFSYDEKELKGRNMLMFFLIVPMMFSGGLVPTFLLLRQVRLINSFWVLIIPWSVQIFNIIILMNFFRNLPQSIRESAMIDGASHITIIFKVYVPISTAAMATLILFAAVWHWNDWFTGLVFLNDNNKWPLQTFLRQLTLPISDPSRLTKEKIDELAKMSNRSFKSAQIFISVLPLLIVYPFLQKYFIKGIVLGSVKG